MNSQILVLLAVALFALLLLRRALRIRSLKQYSPGEVDELLKSKNGVVLLDVRTDQERRMGGIKGSLHIPLHAVGSRMHELEKHKGREIVCYCQSGNRSVSAALLLRRNGFTVANLRGGIAEWNYMHR